ncbi:MAG: hypothetical protein CMI22_10630 [Opitutae bacterium]|nr:hypothetical protein [Opitutae bacterium]
MVATFHACCKNLHRISKARALGKRDERFARDGLSLKLIDFQGWRGFFTRNPMREISWVRDKNEK